MSSNSKHRRDVATRLGAGLAEAAATAAAMRTGWKQSAPAPKDPYDRMALAHERERADYARKKRKYESRLAALRSRTQAFTWTAVGTGAVAFGDLVVDGPETLFWLGAPVAVVSAYWARATSQRANRMTPPKPPTAPPPPPKPLPPGVVGAAESVHLHRVRVQLAQLMPTIAGLHEDAAIELRRADFEAAPALGALVERLAVLHRVGVDMTGTAAAITARNSAEEIRARLAEGVSMYEDLLNATLQMLSAPDPRHAPSHRLEVSVRELTAYTEGLRIAAGQQITG